MKIFLINDKLVVKMRKTSKIALLIAAIILIILVIVSISIGDRLPFLLDKAFFIISGFILAYFVIYMLWLILSSKQDYKTITLEFNRFYLEGPKGQLEVKFNGLAFIEIDESFLPDLYINFIYNENTEYKVMIHKKSWPELQKFLVEHRLNYRFKKTEND